MFSSRSDRPFVPGYHPEFGLLCPSPRGRRVMRLAMLCVATTMAIGATMGLAVARWPDRDGLAVTSEPMNEPAQAPAAGIDATPARESCKSDTPRGLAAYFLNAACGSNKLHARHGARTASRVATVSSGRTDAVPESMEVAPPPATTAAVEEAGNAGKPANSTMGAVDRADKSKAKASAPIVSLAGEIGRWNAMYGAYASTAASRIGRETYDPNGNTLRSAALRSGFTDPIARSWSPSR
jgi:hypothetical protein